MPPHQPVAHVWPALAPALSPPFILAVATPLDFVLNLTLVLLLPQVL